MGPQQSHLGQPRGQPGTEAPPDIRTPPSMQPSNEFLPQQFGSRPPSGQMPGQPQRPSQFLPRPGQDQVSEQMRRLPLQQQQQQNAQVGELLGEVMMASKETGQSEAVGGTLFAQPGLQQGRAESSTLKSSQQPANARLTEPAPHQPTMSRSETDEVTGSRSTLLGSRNRDENLNRKAILTGPGKRGSIAFNLFGMVDSDGNGFISRSEFRAAMKQGLLKRTHEKHPQDSQKGLTRSEIGKEVKEGNVQRSVAPKD